MLQSNAESTLRIKQKEQSEPVRRKEADETIQPGATLGFSNFFAAINFTKNKAQKDQDILVNSDQKRKESEHDKQIDLKNQKEANFEKDMVQNEEQK